MTTLRRWDDPDAFRARAHDFLLPNEAANNMLFGLAHAIAAGHYDEADLFTLEDGDAIRTVALRTPPHNLVLAASDDGAAEVLADALLDAEVDAPGVTGPAEEAAAFGARWEQRTGRRATRTMAQRIFAITEARAPQDVAGAPRPAARADEDRLAAWLVAFEAEAHGADDPSIPDPGAWVRRRLGDGIDAGIMVWEQAGEVVSFAGFGGPTPNGIRVGPVYTPPAQRRRGYAEALVAALSARLLERRRFCFLFTDLANPTSNAIYQRIGYRAVRDAAMYRFTDAT